MGAGFVDKEFVKYIVKLHNRHLSPKSTGQAETLIPCTLCGKKESGFVCAKCAAKPPAGD